MKVEWVGEQLSEEYLGIIKSLASNSSHPLSATIAASIDSKQKISVDEFKEIPSMGITGSIHGKRINLGSKKFVLGKEEEEPDSTNVYVFIDNKVRGHFKIENQYRRGLEEVISDLKKKHKLFLLSGDNESEKKNLQPIFGENTSLLFNQSPSDKMEFIRKLKNDKLNVLMIGDGLNDAGALMESQVGITVADDIYSFSPACDGIIESSKFSKLNRFIKFTNVSMNVVKISFVISFLYNLIGIYFAVQGTLSPLIAAILMPISSVSVVAFATFAISIRARRNLM
jgi:Cu+-exporting ATPase